MYLFDELNLDIGYVLVGVVGFSFILFVLSLVLLIKLSKLNKKYNRFMEDADGKSLEIQFVKKFNEVDKLKHESNELKANINMIKDNLQIAYQKSAIVKYDAFKEMGGKLSFALALLTDNNDGFIINSMHSSREGCYTYIKEIIKGESYVVLAEEEKLALEEAKGSKEYTR